MNNSKMDFPFYPHETQTVKFITVNTFLMKEEKKNSHWSEMLN